MILQIKWTVLIGCVVLPNLQLSEQYSYNYNLQSRNIYPLTLFSLIHTKHTHRSASEFYSHSPIIYPGVRGPLHLLFSVFGTLRSRGEEERAIPVVLSLSNRI